MPPQDPTRDFRYRVEIDGIEQARFAEISIGDLSADPIDYRQGDEITTVRKLNGLNKYANIALKWGITDSTELADWHELIVDESTSPNEARRTVIIRVQDEIGEDKAAFEVTKAWPNKYDPTELSATGNEVAIESLEFSHEGFHRIRKSASPLKPAAIAPRFGRYSAARAPVRSGRRRMRCFSRAAHRTPNRIGNHLSIGTVE